MCGALISAVSLGVVQIAAATQPDQLICGFENVEDMVALPDSPWIIGSGIGDGYFQQGALHLFHRDTATGKKVVLDIAGDTVARAPYDQCPAPPDQMAFSAHGLGLAADGDGSYNLFVVNHGGRESIEVFAVTPTGDEPRFEWIGCIISPPNAQANAVTPRKDGGVVMSASYAGEIPVPDFAEIARNGMKVSEQDMAAAREAMKYGAVFTWTREAGWKKVPGSELLGNNGIELSADERWAFVNSWPGSSMTYMPLEPGLGEPKEVRLGFHPDNIRYGSDGQLVAAGHTVGEDEVAACVMANDPHCAIDYRLASIDPETLAVKQLFDGTGTRHFGVATVGLRVEDSLWIGSVRSDCIARVAVPGS